jgi:drug/metabolite transporter (DMT)-like permease
VITFVLGTSLLGEIFSWQKVIGVALVVLANIALLWGGWERLHISRSGLRYSGLVVLSLGVGWTMDKVVAPWYGVALYTYVSCGLPALVNIWWSRIGWRDLSQELKTGGKWLALLPALAVIGYFALVKALVLGDVSSAVSVATATTPMVMLLGLVFLKETNQWKRKIVATLLTMMGVWLLST